MYYVRKMSNNPNYEKVKSTPDIGDMAADILKQELGTTNNTLSFWKCDSLDQNKDALKAILLSTTSIKTSQFYFLSDEIIEKYNLTMDDTEEGKTGYRGYEKLHVNMIDLNYSKIGRVLQMLYEVFNHPELTLKLHKAEIKKYIQEVAGDGLLNTDEIDDKLKHEIQKFIEI